MSKCLSKIRVNELNIEFENVENFSMSKIVISVHREILNLNLYRIDQLDTLH